MEERMWEEWEEWREEVQEKEKWFLLVKEGKGKEEYVGLKKRQRGLIGSVRLRVTNTMGDKGQGGGVCRLCGEDGSTLGSRV
jgi:hypothetical protein